MNEKEKIPLLSFFTGGGFMDMGFERAGFEVVWTNEIDPAFIKLYSDGINSWKETRGESGKVRISNSNSISSLDSSIILQEAFKDNTPELFGVIGGPPCQDFSVRGSLNGFKGDKGTLTDAYLVKVLELLPAFFVMENVTGLLKLAKNALHFYKLLEVVRECYHVDIKVLNSLNFGVPQFRERVFVIGLRRDLFGDVVSDNLIQPNWFPYPVNAKYRDATVKYKWPVAVAFGTDIGQPDKIPYELCIDSCLVSTEDEATIPNALECFNLLGDKRRFKSIKEGETNRQSFKRLHRYKFSPTACYGNNEVHMHPYKHRRLSVRETLRIQGVEDSYILGEGPLSKKFKMIGNGVPVPLAEAVANSLFTFLENYNQRIPWISGRVRSAVLL